MRRILARAATVGLMAVFLTPTVPGHAVQAALPVVPGSVSPIINSTSGSPTFSTLAVAAGWAPTATITVTYRVYERGVTTHPYSLVDTVTHTCTTGTACSTPTEDRTYHGYVKVVGYASGAGGPAENNGAAVVRHVG